MRVLAHGCENNETIVFLHGGGLGPWCFDSQAQLLREKYRVLLPVLDGHAGSDHPFDSVRNCAERVIDYIDAHCGGRVKAICGLSLGAQVAAQMLALRGDICEYALLESASVVPSRLTAALVDPMFRVSFGLIRKPWFAKLQFRYLRIREALFPDYYKDTCALRAEDLIAFTKASAQFSLPKGLDACTARVCVVCGAREQRSVKRSANLLHSRLQDSVLRFLPKLRHGEYALNHPQQYVKDLQHFLSE